LFVSCAESGKERLPWGDLTIYRKTNEELGHQFVKTEQFIVPVGTVIPIKGLEFEPGVTNLTTTHERIVQQIFNSIEELTENTMGDTNLARTAEFKKMKFQIRGYPDNSSTRETSKVVSQARANAVANLLTYLGTPAWRMKAVGIYPKTSQDQKRNGTVVFVRVS